MIYFSSYIGKLNHHYMICEYKKSFQIRKYCNCLFVDSGILCKDRDITKIVKYQRIGDIVAPPDVIEDVDKTIKNTLEWYNLCKSIHPISSICFVLQGRTKDEYIECYNKLVKEIGDLKFIGLGGLLHSSKNSVQVKEILSLIPFFKSKGLQIHIFGLGPTWINLLLKYNPFSFDCSTIVRIAVDGCVLNYNLKSICIHPNGMSVSFREKLANINNELIVEYINKYEKSNQSMLEIH